MAVDNKVIVGGLLQALITRILQTEGAERDRLVEMVIGGLIEQGDPSFAVLILPGPNTVKADTLANVEPQGHA